MPLITEIEARGIQTARQQLIEFFRAFKEGERDVKSLNKEMRQLAAPLYGQRRALMLLGTEWRMQHATLIEASRMFRSIGSVGRSLTSMFTAYTAAQIRIERIQRDVAEATKDVAEAQDRYNRYLEVFGEDSVFTQRALEDLQKAREREKELIEAQAKAQQDLNFMWLSFGLQAPLTISAFIDIGKHVKTLTALIAAKGGLTAAIGGLGSAFLSVAPALMFIIPIVAAYTKDFEAAEKAFHGWATSVEERGKDVVERMEEAREAIKEMRKEAESMGVGKPLAAGGGWSRGGQFGIPYVPETGLYLLHKGERVIRATERIETTTPKLINIRNTFYIQSLSSEIDLEDLSRRISEKTIEKLGEKW